ncbi:hypothetical protein BCR33DRAFT_718142, partial [Rhizoclosmatium globosum]
MMRLNTPIALITMMAKAMTYLAAPEQVSLHCNGKWPPYLSTLILLRYGSTAGQRVCSGQEKASCGRQKTL